MFFVVSEKNPACVGYKVSFRYHSVLWKQQLFIRQTDDAVHTDVCEYDYSVIFIRMLTKICKNLFDISLCIPSFLFDKYGNRRNQINEWKK